MSSMDIYSFPSRETLSRRWNSSETPEPVADDNENEFVVGASRKSPESSTKTDSTQPTSSDDMEDVDDSSSVDLLVDAGQSSGGTRASVAPPPPPSASPPTAFEATTGSTGSTTVAKAVAGIGAGAGAGADSNSSSDSDDIFSLEPSWKRSGEGKRRARVGRESVTSGPSGSSRAPFPPDRSRVLLSSPRHDCNEVVLHSTGKGKGKGKRKAQGTANTSAAALAALAVPAAAVASPDSPQQESGGDLTRREVKRKRALGSIELDAPTDAPITLADSPPSLSTLPPPRARGHGSTVPVPPGVVRRKKSKADKPTAPGASLSARSRWPSSNWPLARQVSAAATAAAATSSRSTPSSFGVLDLSIASSPPIEVIDVLDDSTHGAAPSRLSPGHGRSGGSTDLGGRSAAPGSAASPRRRRMREEHGETPGEGLAQDSASAARRRRMLSEPLPSRASSSSAAASLGGGPAIVVDVDDEDLGGSSAVDVSTRRRRHRQRIAAAGNTAAASHGGVARGADSTASMSSSSWRRRRPASSEGDHLAAARLQREESERQERRDAEMARRLQSEEQHGAAAEIGSSVLGSAGDLSALVGDSGDFWSDVASFASGGIPTRTAGAARSRSTSSGSRGRGGSSAIVPGRHGGGRRGESSAVAGARERRQESNSNRAETSLAHAARMLLARVQTLSHQARGYGHVGGVAGHPAGSLAALQGRDLTSADYQQLLALDDRGGGGPVKKGLSPSEVAMLPRQTGNGNGPVDQCCICMEDMTSRQSIIRLPACLHTFHSKCITKWLKEKPCCPIDKTAVSINNPG